MPIHELKQFKQLLSWDFNARLREELRELVYGKARGPVFIKAAECLFQASLMKLCRNIFHF
jgi:hypothetical protein